MELSEQQLPSSQAGLLEGQASGAPSPLHSCWERDVRNYAEVPFLKKKEFTHQLMSQGVHFLSNTERLPAC